MVEDYFVLEAITIIKDGGIQYMNESIILQFELA